MADLASPAFQRAFAALSYLAGRREAELLLPLSSVHEDSRAFVHRLGHAERGRRAEVLARELSRVASSLEARRLR